MIEVNCIFTANCRVISCNKKGENAFMFEQYKHYKLCMKGVHEVSTAQNVTREVSGSHFRFVRETF
jgi:hypothetical protein